MKELGPLVTPDTLCRWFYPSGERNDQRNEGNWDVNLSYRKNFRISRGQGFVGVEVDNVLNSDDLTILE